MNSILNRSIVPTAGKPRSGDVGTFSFSPPRGLAGELARLETDPDRFVARWWDHLAQLPHWKQADILCEPGGLLARELAAACL